MSRLIFKQRCFHPNRPKAAVSNREHIRYIATRTGVVCNAGMSHGLFGRAFGMAVNGDVENLDEFKRQVRGISEQKTIVYRTIISLNEADALLKGYDKRAAWEQLIQSNLSTIADKMHIKADKLEWCAAVHMDKGHPHAHLLYWERDQGIRKAWIAPIVSNAIRRGLTKYVFADELAQLYGDKTAAREDVDAFSKSTLSELSALVGGMDKREYDRLLAELQATDPNLCTGSLMYNKIPASRYAHILTDLLALRNAIPKTGRLSYKLMPPDIKEHIDAITAKILAANTNCKREFDRYIHTAIEVAEMYTSDDNILDSAGKKAYAELMNKIGNEILHTVKELSALNKQFSQDERREQYQRQAMENLLSEIFFILSQSSQQQEARAHVGKGGELSKQAKKELAIKLQDHGADWER